MKRTLQGWSIIGLLMGILVFSLVLPAQAATVTNMSDLVSNHTISVGSDHTITFTASDAVTNGETITITFNTNFDVTNISAADVAVSADAVGLVATTDFTMSVSGQVVTVTLLDGYASGTVWEIKIGTHVIGGGNQVINPDRSGSFRIDLGGTFGGDGFVYVPILESNQVSVSAYVPSPEELAGDAPASGITGGAYLGSCAGTRCIDRIILVDSDTVLLSGSTSPGAEIEVTSNGRLVAQVTADDTGDFQIGIDTGLLEGDEVVLIATDQYQRRTPAFPLVVLQPVSGAVLYYEDIVLGPTTETGVSEGQSGNQVTIYGQTVPGARLVVTIDESQVFYTVADALGDYEVSFTVTEGTTVVYVVAIHPDTYHSSAKSAQVVITVNDGKITLEDIVPFHLLSCEQRGDITGDGKVTLGDLAYIMTHRGEISFFNLVLRRREAACLNADGRLDLADMSISSFYLSIPHFVW